VPLGPARQPHSDIDNSSEMSSLQRIGLSALAIARLINTPFNKDLYSRYVLSEMLHK